MKKAKKKKVVCLIQARINSSRLPGKVMKKINGLPLIQIIVNTVKKCKNIDLVVVNTTMNQKDDSLVSYLKRKKIEFFRGSELDALDRFYKASLKYQADFIVRLTADNPLVDHSIIDKVVKEGIKTKVDYISNDLIRSYPYGYDVEMLTFDTLEKIWKESNDKDERESVTLYIRRNEKFFKTKNILSKSTETHPEWRLTVDEKKDLKLIRKIFKILKDKKNISYQDVIKILERNPQLLKINEGVIQKTV